MSRRNRNYTSFLADTPRIPGRVYHDTCHCEYYIRLLAFDDIRPGHKTGCPAYKNSELTLLMVNNSAWIPQICSKFASLMIQPSRLPIGWVINRLNEMADIPQIWFYMEYAAKNNKWALQDRLWAEFNSGKIPKMGIINGPYLDILHEYNEWAYLTTAGIPDISA